MSKLVKLDFGAAGGCRCGSARAPRGAARASAAVRASHVRVDGIVGYVDTPVVRAKSAFEAREPRGDIGLLRAPKPGPAGDESSGPIVDVANEASKIAKLTTGAFKRTARLWGAGSDGNEGSPRVRGGAMPSHHLSPALRRRARAGRRGRRQHRPAVLRRSPRPVRGPLHLGRQAPQPLPAGVQRPDRRLLRQVRQSHRGRRVALRRERRHHQRRLRPGVRQSPAEAHRGVARHRQLRVDAARPARGVLRPIQRPLLHVPQRPAAHRSQRSQGPVGHRRGRPANRVDVPNRRSRLLVPDARVRRHGVRGLHRRVRVRGPALGGHQVEVPGGRARRVHRRHRQPHRQRHHFVHGRRRRDAARGERQLRHVQVGVHPTQAAPQRPMAAQGDASHRLVRGAGARGHRVHRRGHGAVRDQRRHRFRRLLGHRQVVIRDPGFDPRLPRARWRGADIRGHDGGRAVLLETGRRRVYLAIRRRGGPVLFPRVGRRRSPVRRKRGLLPVRARRANRRAPLEVPHVRGDILLPGGGGAGRRRPRVRLRREHGLETVRGSGKRRVTRVESDASGLRRAVELSAARSGPAPRSARAAAGERRERRRRRVHAGGTEDALRLGGGEGDGGGGVDLGGGRGVPAEFGAGDERGGGASLRVERRAVVREERERGGGRGVVAGHRTGRGGVRRELGPILLRAE
mmetsp:Transcript_5713/g.23597  ORF Transcript_5713/g.23597 Transcript_5713/m.23597 type:complete len:687 (+) Transcript_5713:198-2258(+)